MNDKLELKEITNINIDSEWVNVKNTFTLDKSGLKISNDMFRSPNISSHTLVDLCGLNKYASKGKTLLSMFGLIERKDIPLYQMIKGGIVEVLANKYLDDLYGGRYNIESFELEQFENYNQFPNFKPFTGALDKVIHLPTILPVEIKSKEMRAYEQIATNLRYPPAEIVQGANQAFMYGADRFMMLYGFLTPELSEYLKEVTKTFTEEVVVTDAIGNQKVEFRDTSLWIWGKDYEQAVKDLNITFDDVIFHHEIMPYDERLIKAYRDRAVKIYDEFKKTGFIPSKDFKKEELSQLKEFLYK